MRWSKSCVTVACSLFTDASNKGYFLHLFCTELDITDVSYDTTWNISCVIVYYCGMKTKHKKKLNGSTRTQSKNGDKNWDHRSHSFIYLIFTSLIFFQKTSLIPEIRRWVPYNFRRLWLTVICFNTYNTDTHELSIVSLWNLLPAPSKLQPMTENTWKET